MYDGKEIRAYVNGTLDATHGPGADADNPFAYPNPPSFPNGGIFSGGHADFAMGANIVSSSVGAPALLRSAAAEPEIAFDCVPYPGCNRHTQQTARFAARP